MPDIKTRKKKDVKELNRTIKQKKADIRKNDRRKKVLEDFLATANREMKNKKSNNSEDTREEKYATQKIENSINKTTNKAITSFNKIGYESTKDILRDINNIRTNYNRNITQIERQVNNDISAISNERKTNTNANTEKRLETKDNVSSVNNFKVSTKNNTEIINNKKITIYNPTSTYSSKGSSYSNRRYISKEKINTSNKILIKTKDEVLKSSNIKIKNKRNIYNIKEIGKDNKIKTKIDNKNTSNNNYKSVVKSSKNKYIKKIEEIIEKTKKKVNNARKIIKAIIVGTEKFIKFLIAGGWLIMLIVIVICLISILITSIFGIFLSDKVSNNTVTIKSTMSELNSEFINRLTNIQNTIPHNEFDIQGDRANWKDIIAVFIAKYSDGDYRTELIFLDDNKVNYLKRIFWEMNEITYTTEEVEKEMEVTDDKGNTRKIKYNSTILHIKINGKKINDMNLSNKQLAMINEIMQDDYIDLWNNLLYGTSNGSTDIVEVAISQIGNVGGEPYWSWYGFSNRVAWCACFISWCANECGYIERGIIPKFAACQSEGIAWFKASNLWQEAGYIANPGDIIFFDWEYDGNSDHVRYSRKG